MDISKKGTSTGIQIKIRNLSLKDNGVKFEYSYIDDDLRKETGFNTVEVVSMEDEERNDKGFLLTKLVYACVIVIVALVAITTLVHLVKRGLLFPRCYVCTNTTREVQEEEQEEDEHEQEEEEYSFTKENENNEESSLPLHED